MRCLIVDDEPLARDTIRILLETCPEVDVVGECPNGYQAVQRLRAGDVDLVFLDVQMSGTTGFDVIEAVGSEQMPLVVFVTAYDSYALQAFEAQALDYLLKPFDNDRFLAVLAHARREFRDRGDAAFGRRLATLLSARGANGTPGTVARGAPLAGVGERLVIQASGRTILLDPRQIDWVEAARYCVRIHTGDKAYVTRESLERIEKRLAPLGFVRSHRSALVNLTRVREVRRHRSGEASIVLEDGTCVRLSRSRRRSFQERLNAATRGPQ